MRAKSSVTAAGIVAALAVWGVAQPATAQANYPSLPSYAARPPGMCWHHSFEGNQENGYWGACKSNSPAATTGSRAQATQPNRMTRQRR
jgi:hypothetical protein